ncbi:PREDICTED: TRPM8 channel-associated factor 2 isoform X6 [Cercocebus atys]|uniref:TRPM8 channel-associated factor 2 isoform X6 n=1 Tax=Cercocebus atys TaxID=9531 RepID=UPI0005F50A1F|nr:PREDICTED: TRPM8 channel-associated factor 2 isoform X6 [Cercocebus atys]
MERETTGVAQGAVTTPRARLRDGSASPQPVPRLRDSPVSETSQPPRQLRPQNSLASRTGPPTVQPASGTAGLHLRDSSVPRDGPASETALPPARPPPPRPPRLRHVPSAPLQSQSIRPQGSALLRAADRTMATTAAAAFEALMDGVTCWDVPRDPVPSELLLIGEAAFPVMVNDKGQVLIAASSYGQGRLVVVSHEGYLLHAGLAPFLLNAVSWLCPCPGAPMGVHPSLAPLVNILQDAGLEAQVKPEPGEPLGVYCINAYNDTMTATLIQFVKHGGGLLIGGQAWYWASQHGPEKVLSRFPGNKVTSVAGVYFTDTYGDRDRFKVSKKVPKIPLHVRCGEDVRQDQQQLLEGISELDIRTGGVPSQLLVHGALAFPLGLDASLNCFLAAARYGRGRVVLAAHECLLCAPKMRSFLLNAVRWLARGQTGKVGVNTNLKDLCPLLLEHGLQCSLEPHLNSNLCVYCCKAYSDKEAKQLQEFVAEGGGLLIGGQAWWWASQNPGHCPLAGFPGNVILNCFGLSILPQTLKAGCFPVPTLEMRSYHFRKALSEFQAILNHENGNLEKSCLAKLRVDGAAFLQIPAEGIPAYISLHRLLRKMLRGSGLPAVSRENPVASDSYEAAMLSLATGLAHSGTDCSQLAQGLGTWTCSSSLYPSKHPITVEIDGINPGWMHSGYPIMCHLESVKEIINEMDMRSRGVWGPIHELGHNQQRHGWEFPPHTTEATCNLWSVYVHETVLGIPRAQAHEALSPPERGKRIKAHLGKGAPLCGWNVWTALETYLQLQEAFGWEPFTQLFAEYQTLSHLPKGNTGRMNLWVKKFSEKVKKNLVPFFEAWGWPVQKEVADSLASLPEWQENPMQVYLRAKE